MVVQGFPQRMGHGDVVLVGLQLHMAIASSITTRLDPALLALPDLTYRQ